MQKWSIIFTGGGSGGHVMPSLTLIKKIRNDQDIDVYYIGGVGIEKELCAREGISFKEISTGKLRRYLSVDNLIDQAKIIKGLLQSLIFLSRFKRQSSLVFATGGFVEVPVVIAAFILRIPIYIHEQTTRVGLANKISSYFAKKIFVSFEASRNFFPKNKTFFSGYPLRDDCYQREINSNVFGIDLKNHSRPTLFITGGGNGSKLLNDFLLHDLILLKDKFTIFHQVGKSYIKEFEQYKSEHYRPFDFIGSEMLSLLFHSTVVISRAGAGTVCELMALQKRSIYIPLKIAQKNEQFHNACEARNLLGSFVIEEDQLKNRSLRDLLTEFQNTTASALVDYKPMNGTEFLLKEIRQILKI